MAMLAYVVTEELPWLVYFFQNWFLLLFIHHYMQIAFYIALPCFQRAKCLLNQKKMKNVVLVNPLNLLNNLNSIVLSLYIRYYYIWQSFSQPLICILFEFTSYSIPLKLTFCSLWFVVALQCQELVHTMMIMHPKDCTLLPVLDLVLVEIFSSSDSTFTLNFKTNNNLYLFDGVPFSLSRESYMSKFEIWNAKFQTEKLSMEMKPILFSGNDVWSKYSIFQNLIFVKFKNCRISKHKCPEFLMKPISFREVNNW